MPAKTENRLGGLFQKGLSKVQQVAEKVLFDYTQEEKDAIAEAYRVRVLQKAPAFIKTHNLLAEFRFNQTKEQSKMDKHLLEFLEGQVTEHMLILEQCPPRPPEGSFRRKLATIVGEHKGNSSIKIRTALDIQRGFNQTALDNNFSDTGDSYDKANAIKEYFTALNRATISNSSRTK